MTELEAVAALCSGDEQGFEALVKLYEGRAFAVAVVMLRDPSLADDVVSEAFLKAFRFRERFDPQRDFWPWFLRILANEARTAIRRRTRRERLAQVLRRLPGRREDPVEVAESNELRRWLVAAIGLLPVGEREVVQLRFLLDLDEKSIAEIVGCPLGTVKVRLHRARRHLRERALRELDGYLPERLSLGANSHV